MKYQIELPNLQRIVINESSLCYLRGTLEICHLNSLKSIIIKIESLQLLEKLVISENEKLETIEIEDGWLFKLEDYVYTTSSLASLKYLVLSSMNEYLAVSNSSRFGLSTVIIMNIIAHFQL